MCIKFSGIAQGSTVYDPFIGTGTTILAAVKNGMKGVGTDVDDEYLNFAKQRLENMLGPKKETHIASKLFE
jgi:site-specific DNA-methyltransferase (adenine-specific)